MTETTHTFAVRGELAEVYVVVATAAEWAADPRSGQPGRSAWRDDQVVVAVRLVLPAAAIAAAAVAAGRNAKAP